MQRLAAAGTYNGSLRKQTPSVHVHFLPIAIPRQAWGALRKTTCTSSPEYTSGSVHAARFFVKPTLIIALLLAALAASGGAYAREHARLAR